MRRDREKRRHAPERAQRGGEHMCQERLSERENKAPGDETREAHTHSFLCTTNPRTDHWWLHDTAREHLGKIISITHSNRKNHFEHSIHPSLSVFLPHLIPAALLLSSLSLSLNNTMPSSNAPTVSGARSGSSSGEGCKCGPLDICLIVLCFLLPPLAVWIKVRLLCWTCASRFALYCGLGVCFD